MTSFQRRRAACHDDRPPYGVWLCVMSDC